MTRELARVAVVGLGTMGSRIAEVLARAGLDVTAVDLDAQRLEHGRQTIVHFTDRAVERGKMGRLEQTALLDRLTLSTDLDAIVATDTVLATDTSSLSVTEISAATGQPGRVLGLHFFNPAPVQQLAEVISTVVTAPDATQEAVAVRVPQPRAIDVRDPVRVARGHRRGDAPGMRLPDGSVGAARPDRDRYRVRDPRDDVPPRTKPGTRSRPGAEAAGHRRDAGTQVRTRLLHLRR